jgi:malate dehydrogenase (oxaloacetate-decarboxylating)
LGNIGPKAGLPVIEGKALLFKYFGGVDAIPITLDEENPEKIIEIIIGIQPAFGAINLEDISTPKCYYILEELQKRLDIPVWHDDRQGTATVTLAGLINAIKLAGKNKNNIKIAFIGTGAAGLACANLLYKWGVDKENSIFVDINGILGKHRTEFPDDSIFREICETTNRDQIEGGIQEAMVGADVVIAFSKPGPDIIKPTWIKRMANKPIVFACANPIPEIWPWEAKKAGAFIVGTGRSDFDNQINNSLVFPGIFRGVLDVRAKKITDEMCFAAAQTLADFKNDQLSPDNILPKMTEMDIFPQQAAAVARKAIEQGYSQLDLSKEQLYLIAKKRILENQNLMDLISQKIS